MLGNQLFVNFVANQNEIQQTTGFYATQSYTINWVQIAWKPDRRHGFLFRKIDGIFIKVSSHFKVEMIFGRKSCVRQLLMLLLFVCEAGARLGVAGQPNLRAHVRYQNA